MGAGLDEKDCIILNLLQEDCRISLTDIAKQINLSVDSTKKRVEKLKKNRIFYPRIQLRPRAFGFNNFVQVKIKLQNYTDEDIKNFIQHLQETQHITEIFSLAGDWDFSVVMMAKDPEDLAVQTQNIRKKFNGMIRDWSETLTTSTHKFETYDMLKLLGHTQENNEEE